jgi:hypothetical protein
MPVIGRLERCQVRVRAGCFVVTHEPDDLRPHAMGAEEPGAMLGVVQQQVYRVESGHRSPCFPDACREAGRVTRDEHDRDTGDQWDMSCLADIVQQAGQHDGSRRTGPLQVTRYGEEMVLVIRGQRVPAVDDCIRQLLPIV